MKGMNRRTTTIIQCNKNKKQIIVLLLSFFGFLYPFFVATTITMMDDGNDIHRKELHRQQHQHQRNIPRQKKRNAIFASSENSFANSSSSFIASNDPLKLSSSSAPSSSSSSPSPSSMIRSWGCHLTQTPLTFVHIGKAGGGQIRARFAAAAIDFTRKPMRWKRTDLDQHYYPITIQRIREKQNRQEGRQQQQNAASMMKMMIMNETINKYDKKNYIIDDNNTLKSPSSLPFSHNIENDNIIVTEKGYYCNAMYRQYRTISSNIFNNPNNPTTYCEATTPLGLAIACPEPTELMCHGCSDMSSATCHTIYTGHMNIGSEIHWLPSKYLLNWWKSTPWYHHQQQHQQQHQIINDKNDDNKNTNRDGSHNHRRHRLLSNTIKDRLRTLHPNDMSWCNNDDVMKMMDDMGNNSDNNNKNSNASNGYDVSSVISVFNHSMDDEYNVSTTTKRRYHTQVPNEVDEYIFKKCSKPLSNLIDPIVDELLYDEQQSNEHHQRQRRDGRKNMIKNPPIDDGTATVTKPRTTSSTTKKNYGPIYASMPVQRVVMIREPFDWLVSRYLWDERTHKAYNCTNLIDASMHYDQYHPDYAKTPTTAVTTTKQQEQEQLKKQRQNNEQQQQRQYGWGVRFALIYIFYLCGNDCMIRYELGLISSLDELEEQATYNLRNSFSVVGILEYEKQRTTATTTPTTMAANNNINNTNTTTEIDTDERKIGNDDNHNGDTVDNKEKKHEEGKVNESNNNFMPFYEMVTKRIGYVDMHLNPKVKGQRHSSVTKKSLSYEQIQQCKTYFQSESNNDKSNIRQQWIEQIPELGVVQRLYQVAIEVNQFQQNELRTCPDHRPIPS